eukprot:gene19504-21432_t
MVRTRADCSVRRAVVAKAPRKQVGNSAARIASTSTSGGGSSAHKGGYSGGGGGNPLRICPTPSWQKGIAEFYPKVSKKEKPTENSQSSAVEACSSAASSSSASDNAINGDCDMRTECRDTVTCIENRETNSEEEEPELSPENPQGLKEDENLTPTTTTAISSEGSSCSAQSNSGPNQVGISIPEAKPGPSSLLCD